jgi:hypothetical protein
MLKSRPDMTSPGEPISVAVKLRFWEAYRVTALMTYRMYRVFLIPVVTIAVIFLVFSAFILLNPSPNHSFHQLIESFGATPYVLLGFGVFFVGLPLLSAWKVQSNPRVQAGVRYRITDTAVEIDTAVAHSSLTWPAFVQAVETPRFFLLFVTKGIAHILPKRCLSDEGEISAIRQLIRQNVLKAKLKK